MSLQAASSNYAQRVKVRWQHHVGTTPSQSFLHLHRVQQACRKAYHLYLAKPYAGPITLIRSKWRSEEEFQGWSKLTSDLRSHEIPVEHQKLFVEPDVEQLAGVLAELLAGRRYDEVNGPPPARQVGERV